MNPATAVLKNNFRRRLAPILFVVVAGVILAACGSSGSTGGSGGSGGSHTTPTTKPASGGSGGAGF